MNPALPTIYLSYGPVLSAYVQLFSRKTRSPGSLSQKHLTINHSSNHRFNRISTRRNISAGVPQGSIRDPFLLYNNDIPQNNKVATATFADNTALLAPDQDIQSAKNKDPTAVNKVTNWRKKWRINLNKTKSIHVNLTNKKYNYIQEMPTEQIILTWL